MSEIYRRKVRIEGGTEDLVGVAMRVCDAETGELIKGAYQAVVKLGVDTVNQAEISYYETDERDHIVIRDGEPVVHVVTADNPEVAVTALENSRYELSKVHAMMFESSKRTKSCAKVRIFGVTGDVQLTAAEALILLNRLSMDKQELLRCKTMDEKGDKK